MYTEPYPSPYEMEHGVEYTNDLTYRRPNNHANAPALNNTDGTCLIEIHNPYETELVERRSEPYMYKRLDLNDTDRVDDDTDPRLQSETMMNGLGTEHHHDLTEVDQQFESIEVSSYINTTINGK